MVAYGIEILPLIKNLKLSFTDVTHPWYGDNTGALGKFVNAELCFNLLRWFGPGRGYYSDAYKIILIVQQDKIEYGNFFDFCHGFKVCKGVHYLFGFIGDDKSKCSFLKERK